MSEKWTTKKDHILHVARQDPFLTVDDIASIVGTTARYVRTILSEANLSLMDMRREYARNMKRLTKTSPVAASSESKSATIDWEPGHLMALPSLGGDDIDEGSVELVQLKDEILSDLLKTDRSKSLVGISAVGRLPNGQPYIDEVVTHKKLVITDSMMRSMKPLRQWLGLERRGATTLIGSTIEVDVAPRRLAVRLGLHEGSPVLKTCDIIETDGERVGLDRKYFDAMAVRIVFTASGRYSLKTKE